MRSVLTDSGGLKCEEGTEHLCLISELQIKSRNGDTIHITSDEGCLFLKEILLTASLVKPPVTNIKLSNNLHMLSSSQTTISSKRDIFIIVESYICLDKVPGDVV